MKHVSMSKGNLTVRFDIARHTGIARRIRELWMKHYKFETDYVVPDCVKIVDDEIGEITELRP